MGWLRRTMSDLCHDAGAIILCSCHSVTRLVRNVPKKWPPFRFSTWSITRLPLLQHDSDPMDSTVIGVWRRRTQIAAAELANTCWVCLIYLFSELAIWGLSRLLAPARIEFFSSILSMLFVFALMTAAYTVWRAVEDFYQARIKYKVDFINTHMGIGFPVPIVMLNEDDILHGREIACIVGNAVITNFISWTLVFLLSYLSWSTYLRITDNTAPGADDRGLPKPLDSPPPQIDVTWFRDHNLDALQVNAEEKQFRPDSNSPSMTATRGTSPDGTDWPVPRCSERPRRAGYCFYAGKFWPIGLALLCIFLVGAPVTAGSSDSRLLDAFVLWFVWISAVTTQRAFKVSLSFRQHLRLRNMTATLMNPVLITTLAMVGYTRLKALAVRNEDLDSVLERFSAGSPLYALWTANVQDITIPANPKGWFGAGDVALSVLECGIFIWGFKLFECRRQLFSNAGALTLVVSAIAAVGNVFLSVLSGRAMGLEKPEALAFAARSATLALAKPAIEAVGGNMVVNAALVVSNGILGQLMYPFTLDILGVKSEVSMFQPLRTGASSADAEQGKQEGCGGSSQEKVWLGHDDAVTVAAGIAIGINGAAMGVSYLYEVKSRAAPYAALSMTVFGVMTVIFTTVGPFKELVIRLAGA